MEVGPFESFYPRYMEWSVPGKLAASQASEGRLVSHLAAHEPTWAGQRKVNTNLKGGGARDGGMGALVGREEL